MHSLLSNSSSVTSRSSRNAAPYRVFLVDDHPVVRMGLRRLFEHTGSLRVSGEAESGKQALPRILEDQPDLALVDISLDGLDGMGGIELTQHLAVQCPEVPVLIVSMHEEVYYVDKVLKAGAGGYVLKDNMGEVLVEAVETILDGERYLSDEMEEALDRAQSRADGKI